ncbi:hypothetical protein ACWEQ8_13620 [Streptomyces noursei]
MDDDVLVEPVVVLGEAVGRARLSPGHRRVRRVGVTQISLTGANHDLAQVDAFGKRQSTAVQLGGCRAWPVRKNRGGEEKNAVIEISGERRSKRDWQPGLAQLDQSGGHALLHSPAIGTHAMLQGASTGGECPRRRVVSHPLSVHSDHGIHALLTQPFEDE